MLVENHQFLFFLKKTVTTKYKSHAIILKNNKQTKENTRKYTVLAAAVQAVAVLVGHYFQIAHNTLTHHEKTTF